MVQGTHGRNGLVARLLACACAIALVVMPLFALPGQAHAYLERGPVSIGLSQTEVYLQVGQSTSISCVVDPVYEDQTPCCFMDYCPEGCGIDTGCLDANGWCTCAGGGYARYTTNVVVMSSDPSVARADWSGGVLNVTAYEEPGVVTLSISASLRMHQASGEQWVTVYVDPRPEPTYDELDEHVGNGEIDGKGDSDSNVINGTGEGDGNLGTGSGEGENGSYDKPGAADASGSPEAPEVPEAPVEPDVSKPVVLYELEEVESDEDNDAATVDPLYAGTTAGMGVLCIGVGAVRNVEYRRRQLS